MKNVIQKVLSQTDDIMATEEEGLTTVVPENGRCSSRYELAFWVSGQNAVLEVLELEK